MIVREHMHETKTFPYGKAAETDPFGEVELIFRKKNITHAPSNVGGGVSQMMLSALSAFVGST